MTFSIRKLAAPALLTAALMPLALTAQAGSHHEGEGREQMREHMQEQRQQVYQRAEINEEKQEALNEANAEFYEAMKELRDEHKERVSEILTDEEQEALKGAMRDVHDERRAERGNRGHGDDDNEDAITTQ
ncbi:hypothetical protein [Vreelandella sp. EE22]